MFLSGIPIATCLRVECGIATVLGGRLYEGRDWMTEPASRSMLVTTPGSGIDSMSALTSSMHASPGLYAVLVGSGMSRSAGQPGAWEILGKLITSYATAQGVDLEPSNASPFDWWYQNMGVLPNYSNVLEQLEPTRGGRQNRLATYFQHAAPSSAHQDLAELCHSGKVQVVITTNFDQLIEQALSTLGVHFQVVNQDNATGMMPLVRGLTTVFKVNGDYLSLGMKNTSLELTKYTRTLTTRLREVVRDYGLIVVGWSGQWDTALRDLLQANPARNYPMYWVAHQGQVSDDAQRLIDNRGAYRIDSSGADEFFTQVASRLDRLDQLSRQRRSTRRALRHSIRYLPNQWNAMPDLESRDIWIRTTVELGPTSLDETGYLEPLEHQEISTALHGAEITTDLMNLSLMREVTTCVPRGSWANSRTWSISREDYLTRDTVGFRLHPQGNRYGLTARSWFQTPAFDGSGDNLLAIFDVGINGLPDRANSPRKLSLAELAYLLLDQFAVQAEILSQTLDHLTADTANLRKVEFHLYVPPRQDHSPRGNVSDYIDLSSLGSDGRESSQMSAAFPLSEPLTRQDQFEIVIEALRHIALSFGYAQPDDGITTLRNVLAHKFSA